MSWFKVRGNSVSDNIIGGETEFAHGTVNFLGKGNPSPAKYVIIPTNYPHSEEGVKNFATSFLFNDLPGALTQSIELKTQPSAGHLIAGSFNFKKAHPPTPGFLSTAPDVLLSVTGGAQDFFMYATEVEQVFNRGIVKAAQNTNAWIVDGGFDLGVMQYVGQAMKEMGVENVPCIGVAMHQRVSAKDDLDSGAGDARHTVEYIHDPTVPRKVALNPNHTHFILVDSKNDIWGQEIVFRSRLEKCIQDKFEIPVVLIVVNGGPGTLQTIAEGSEKGFTVIVVQGSGRASDGVAAMLKQAKAYEKEVKKFIERERDKEQKGKGKKEKEAEIQPEPEIPMSTKQLTERQYEGVDISSWTNLLNEVKPQDQNNCVLYMDRILNRRKTITVFNLDYEAATDMDIFILRSILSSMEKMSDKLNLGVKWNRPDVITEILETEKSGLSSAEKRKAINDAFQLSIELDRPEIFRILSQNGAQKEAVNIMELYYYKPIKKANFRRMPEYSKAKIPKDKNRNKHWTTTAKSKDFFKDVFRHIGHAYHHYYKHRFVKFQEANEKESAENSDAQVKVGYIDILIWAVFSDRMDFAKIVWQLTSLPIHSALLACKLFRYLSSYSLDKETYMANANWFEDEAIKILDKVAYSDVKSVMLWKWERLGLSALEIAQDGKCQRFIAHTHLQRFLDDIFSSDSQGKLDHTTSTLKIWLAILIPPLIRLFYKCEEKNENTLNFYLLPIVKFWTNTLFYTLFLGVQAYVLCILKEGIKIEYGEWILWVWVAGLIVDELTQFIRDPLNHFKYLTNYMDALILILHTAYIILRLISDGIHSPQVFSAAINTLVVACIFSWTRLLSAFAISKSLGRLYFIIIRLFKDIFTWIFVFAVFAASFQLGFISITKQVELNPLSPYPNGTFPVSFFTIIGEFSYAAEMLQEAPLGVPLLAVYALIAQILLVNLLIAMMGDTYTKVSDNSALEWKSYRLDLMMENRSTSFHPPPTNLIIVPIQQLRRLWGLMTKKYVDVLQSEMCVKLFGANSAGDRTYGAFTSIAGEEEKKLDKERDLGLRRLEVARDQVIAQEEEMKEASVETVVTAVLKRLRALARERVNDRSFNKKKFRETSKSMVSLHTALQQKVEEVLEQKLQAILRQSLSSMEERLVDIITKNKS